MPNLPWGESRNWAVRSSPGRVLAGSADLADDLGGQLGSGKRFDGGEDLWMLGSIRESDEDDLDDGGSLGGYFSKN